MEAHLIWAGAAVLIVLIIAFAVSIGDRSQRRHERFKLEHEYKIKELEATSRYHEARGFDDIEHS